MRGQLGDTKSRRGAAAPRLMPLALFGLMSLCWLLHRPVACCVAAAVQGVAVMVWQGQAHTRRPARATVAVRYVHYLFIGGTGIFVALGLDETDYFLIDAPIVPYCCCMSPNSPRSKFKSREIRRQLLQTFNMLVQNINNDQVINIIIVHYIKDIIK